MDIKNKPPSRTDNDAHYQQIKTDSLAKAFFMRFIVRPLEFVKSKLGWGEEAFFSSQKRQDAPHVNTPPIVLDKKKELGEGGFGKVKEVEYQGETVAHKRSHQEKVSEGHENEIMGLFDHPNILKSLSPDKDTIVLVDEGELNDPDVDPDNEYVEVKSVEELKNGILMPRAWSSVDEMKDTLPGSRLLHCSQLLGAVSHIHDKGVCHLDIKPMNILWGRSNALQLCDFGGAVRVNKTGHIPASEEDEVVYSDCYAPPEMMRFVKNIETIPPGSLNGFAVDSWSLACTLAAIITKEEIFREEDFVTNTGQEKHPDDVGYEKIVKNYLEKHKNTLGKGAHDILKRMLDINPATRMTVQEAFQQQDKWFLTT